MEFGLSEEQRLLQDSVNRFLVGQAPLDRVRAFTDSDSDYAGADIWNGLIELGMTALLVPEAQGGIGLTCLDAAIVAECLGYAVTPVPFLGTCVMAPVALTMAGGQDELLANIALGASRVGIAFGEAIGRRADAQVRVEGSKVSGKSIFVMDFNADQYLVATPDKRIYLVAADAQGLGKRHLTTVDKTRPTGELVYHNVAATLVSDDPAVFNATLDAGRVMLAADTLGAAQNMLDQAVSYAMQREQFNRVIASFQAVKHMCAEMAAHLEPCRSMVWYAGHALDHLPDESRLIACHTKAHLSEVGKFVSKTSTEVHGGMGFTDLVGLHFWFKRIGFNRAMLGSPELVREEAARVQGLVA